MNRQTAAPWPQLLALASTLLAAAPAAFAADGQILINQAKAMAGGVTPGDAPGFPVTISQSGSYKLVGDLTVPDENTNGVEIGGSSVPFDVTLDLNGFAIVGPTVCPFSGGPCAPLGTGDGIHVILVGSTAVATVAIYNGTVRGMGRDGITGSVSNLGMLIDRVRAVSNGSDGIFAGTGVVTNSLAIRNGLRGIVGNVSNVQDNVAYRNDFGISLGSGGGAGGNVSASNTTKDLDGGHQISPNLCGSVLCP
jgi:hypothetical protein